ncbi:transcription factor kayak, isoforms D/sro-like [Drosophila obscura]|uniref:transcription factor kayak, isoforms D/sro-like n=1 Tax=Drosophila obscura TaxID=7282 RepID=UPI001BB10F2B|nr:transcription factor kayak, isoforms D/sro-like [Drosophila obscura]
MLHQQQQFQNDYVWANIGNISGNSTNISNALQLQQQRGASWIAECNKQRHITNNNNNMNVNYNQHLTQQQQHSNNSSSSSSTCNHLMDLFIAGKSPLSPLSS